MYLNCHLTGRSWDFQFLISANFQLQRNCELQDLEKHEAAIDSLHETNTEELIFTQLKNTQTHTFKYTNKNAQITTHNTQTHLFAFLCNQE